MSLNNIIDHEVLRERLKKIIRANPDTGRKLSKSIGVSTPTLMKFLSTSEAGFRTLCIIEDWVKLKEELANK